MDPNESIVNVLPSLSEQDIDQLIPLKLHFGPPIPRRNKDSAQIFDSIDKNNAMNTLGRPCNDCHALSLLRYNVSNHRARVARHFVASLATCQSPSTLPVTLPKSANASPLKKIVDLLPVAVDPAPPDSRHLIPVE